MNVSDFKSYLKLMRLANKYVRNDSPGHTWYSYRTDDVLAIETDDTLYLICVGTQPKFLEWFWNFYGGRREWVDMGRVHSGFAHNVEEIVGANYDPQALINHKAITSGKSVEVLGHSRGGALSILLAALLRWNGVNVCKVIVCGTARIGSRKFATNYKAALGNVTYTLYSPYDPVSKAPPWGKLHGYIINIKIGNWYRPKHSLKHYIKAVNEI